MLLKTKVDILIIDWSAIIINLQVILPKYSNLRKSFVNFFTAFFRSRQTLKSKLISFNGSNF